MKTLTLTAALMVFSGCISYDKGSEFSTLSASVDSPTKSDSTSVTSVPMTYLYSLVGGVIFANPIDPDTGNLLIPEYGIWNVRPPGTQDFFHFVMSSDGTFLYAIDKDNEKVYQYSIINKSPYSMYGSNIPLTALNPAFKSVGFARTLLSFGNDDNLYVYANDKVDQYKLTNGVMSFVKQTNSSSTIVSAGLNFSRVNSVSQGNHTYRIDAASNRVIHSVDGADQNSTRITSASGTLTDLAIH